MYLKFLPNNSIGILVLSRNTLESIISVNDILDYIMVYNHTLDVPDLDSAYVIEHTLVMG